MDGFRLMTTREIKSEKSDVSCSIQLRYHLLWEIARFMYNINTITYYCYNTKLSGLNCPTIHNIRRDGEKS